MTKPALPSFSAGDDAAVAEVNKLRDYQAYWHQDPPRLAVRFTGVGAIYEGWGGFSGASPLGPHFLYSDEVIVEDMVGETFTGPAATANITAEWEIPVSGIWRLWAELSFEGIAGGYRRVGYQVNTGGGYGSSNWMRSARGSGTTPSVLFGVREVELDSGDDIRFMVDTDTTVEYRASRYGMTLLGDKG